MNRLIISLLLCAAATPAYTQGYFKKIKEKVNTTVGKTVTANVAGNLLKKDDPITTSFNDVDTSNSLSPEFRNNEKYESLDSLDFGPQGYILKPGFFEAELLSYCIMPGTPSPPEGMGI